MNESDKLGVLGLVLLQHIEEGINRKCPVYMSYLTLSTVSRLEPFQPCQKRWPTIVFRYCIPSHNLSGSWTTTLLQAKEPFRRKKSPIFTFCRWYLHKVADIFVLLCSTTVNRPCTKAYQHRHVFIGNRATLLSEKILGDSNTSITWSYHMIEGIDHMTLLTLRHIDLQLVFSGSSSLRFSQIIMADPEKPSYVAFFGVMGATSAMVFSGEYVVLL